MTSERVDLVAILTLILVVNVLGSGALPERTTAVLQAGAAAVAVGGALLRGYTADDLALSPGAIVDGLRLGVGSAVVIVGAVATITIVPVSRRFLNDDRFADISDGEVWYETVFRIPVITALTEELVFRSVLLGVLLVMTSARSSILVHAVVFGLWHVLTTIGDLGGNDVTDSLATWGRVLAVAGAVIATAVAGVIFGWLRVRSGSVVAPWIAHVSFIASAFLAGVLVVRNGWA